MQKPRGLAYTMGATRMLSGDGGTVLHERIQSIMPRLLAACRSAYGERLVTLALFGSWGRGTGRFDSDLDLLVIARELPAGRMARVREFGSVELQLAPALAELELHGIATRLSPVIKSPEEAQAGSALFLDLVEDAQLVYDEAGFFTTRLARLRSRLAELGARRIWRGNTWHWDLKPDYQPGEVFEL